MSFDIPLTAAELFFLVAGIVVVFMISRAVTMGRKFASRPYRSRAFWFAGVMLTVLFWLLFTTLYLSGADLAAFGEGFSVEVALVTVFVVFVYADRTILVTLDMDFLHRNTLHWKQVRKLAYVALFAGVVDLMVQIPFTAAPTCSTCGAALNPGAPSWYATFYNATGLFFNIDFFGSFLVLFPYAFGAAIIGARRTSDTTMRRHVRWLGLSFLIFLLTFVIGFIVGDILSLAGVVEFYLGVSAFLYASYRALMSLTSIGKVARVETGIKK